MREPDYMKARRHEADLLFADNGADVRLVKWARAVLLAGHQHGIPLRVHCIYRSYAAQQKAFEDGNSKARPGHSPHNYGLAVDIIHATKAWGLTAEQWRFVAVICEETARRQKLPLVWGGSWAWGGGKLAPGQLGWDPAHWELKDWRTEADRGREVAGLYARPETANTTLNPHRLY